MRSFRDDVVYVAARMQPRCASLLDRRGDEAPSTILSVDVKWPAENEALDMAAAELVGAVIASGLRRSVPVPMGDATEFQRVNAKHISITGALNYEPVACLSTMRLFVGIA